MSPVVSDNMLLYFVGVKKRISVLLGHVQLRLSITEEFVQLLGG